MATLNEKRIRKAKSFKRKFSVFILILGILLIPYISAFLDAFITSKFDLKKVSINYFECYKILFTNMVVLKISGIIFLLLLLLIFVILTSSWNKIGTTDTIKITDRIEIPIAVGQGQHGTSRFMTESEKKVEIGLLEYDIKKDRVIDQKENLNLGLVLGMKRDNRYERIFCVNSDRHSLIVGATRSGKTRRMLYETIWLRSLAGKSMIISDPKGELFLHTSPKLKESGYNVIDIDFRYPLKSKRYNYLSLVNETVDKGDIAKAIDYTWDLVSVMVGIPKGEPLWTNGESAVIAAAILAVVLEAPSEFHNMTNVYYFLAYMCKVDENTGIMPITEFFNVLPDEHPAKSVFAVAEISPERTRGSFFGSALATLRLFTNYNIADMTSEMDFDMRTIGTQKTAVFIIIPDEKITLYSLVSLMLNQMYVTLVEVANQFGGRLPIEVEFELDEFGNFPSIPSFGSMLSVGAGRGLRFNLVLQDFQQLEKQYEKDYQNIKGNCQNWVYLKTPNMKTLEEISKKTGTYTVQVNSTNSSVSGSSTKKVSWSDNANMQSRALLMPHEVERIDTPYSLLLISGKYPAIMYAPDLSEYSCNQLFGLGNEQYNREISMERESKRDVRERMKLNLWKIWIQYAEENKEEVSEQEEFSFF